VRVFRQAPFEWSATHRALATAVADSVGIETDQPDPAGEVSWDHFVRLATAHAVHPLVRRSVWLACQHVPSEAHGRLHVAARRSAAAGVRNLAALSELVGAFEGDGIDPVILRGQALSSWAFGDPLARHTTGIHLGVAPAEVAPAARTLARIGYEPIGPGDPDPARLARLAGGPAELTFAGAHAFVDLHWRLAPNPALLPLDLADPTHRCRIEIGGLAVTTLGPEPAWWYGAVHGSRNRWRSLSWLADLSAMARSEPDLLEPAALDRAAAAGVDRCVATALVVAADVLGLSLPPGAADWVIARPVTQQLAPHAHRHLAATGRPRAPGWIDAGVEPGPLPVRLAARVAYDLRLRDDWRYRAGVVRMAALRGLPDATVVALDRLVARPGSLPALGRSALSSIRRWRRLPTWRRQLLAEATAELVRASLLLTVVPSRRTVSLLGTPAGLTGDPPVPPTADELGQAGEIGRAIGGAAGVLPWHPSCLRQAVAARRMLDRRRIPNALHLGVLDASHDAAHAWVRVGEQVVVGGRRTRTFTTVGMFAGPRSGSTR
jgi:hypothetical protein